MEALIAAFGADLLHHCDLAESLQTMYLARSEMKSDGRDKYIAYLKSTGSYEDHLDT